MRCGFRDDGPTSEAVTRCRITKSATAFAWFEQRLHRGHYLPASVTLSKSVKYSAVICVVVADFDGAGTTVTIQAVVVAERRMDDAEKPDPAFGTSDNSRIKPVVISHRFTQAGELVSHSTGAGMVFERRRLIT